MLEQASAFLAAGPRIFDVTAARVVRILKLVSVSAPASHGEIESITEDAPELGEVRLLDGTKSLRSMTRPPSSPSRPRCTTSARTTPAGTAADPVAVRGGARSDDSTV